MGIYDDIIHLNRPASKHARMSLEQRSAQFAPFAALTGYEGQVKEVARLTDKKIYIDEEVKRILDLKLNIIKKNINLKPNIEITYFIQDENKDGGKYEKIKMQVQKIDDINNEILMENNQIVKINDIIDMQGELFCEL